MPGARPKSYRLGDRSELLVEHILASIAFTTRVPRQEDVGLDFICSLISQHDANNLLWAGPIFTVQAKSDTKPIVYEKPHELSWIRNQENPLFICVANRESHSVDIYSTWNLVCAYLGGWRGQKEPDRIELQPGVTYPKWPYIVDNDDGSQHVGLGKPIVSIASSEIFDDGRAEVFIRTMAQWIAIDRRNILNRNSSLNWAAAPMNYETNGSMGPEQGVIFYSHPKNLVVARWNLGLSATALWKILTHDQIATVEDVSKDPWPELIGRLRPILRWCSEFDPVLRAVLGDLEPETKVS